jgi:dienelactone hydrolase
MKYWKLLFVSIAIVLSNLSFALEEPPGTQSQEDADAYFQQAQKDRAEGKIFFDKGIEKSWDESRVYVPGSFFEKSISNLKLEKKYPVVIYLHGCAGITSFNDTRWGKFISEMGFVVILPDSLARPGRVSNCDPSTTSTSHRFPMALPYREQEIFFAIKELKKFSWVDTENIFLMGHSEGANAIAITKAKGLRGVVMSSGYCPNGISFENNLSALVMNFLSDPWHGGSPSRCLTRDKSQAREITYVEINNSGHDTFNESIFREAVVDFLNKKKK